MKRFEEYKKTGSAKKGIISINYGYRGGQVNNLVFKNVNRAFDGDAVYYTTDPPKIVDVERQKYTPIIGILQIMSMTTYGINKKGAHYYMFKPENRKMPRFYVAFDLKKKTNKMFKAKGLNIYCVIEFNYWTCESKCPQGSIIEIIGSVGDIEAEYDYTLYKHKINYKRNKIKFNPVIIGEPINPNLVDPIKNIVSIDPLGCTDIDDALHFKLLPKDRCEVGIHIADVTRYVTHMSEIDIEARKRLSTIYSPLKRIDMLPPWLSTETCSLHPGIPKYTASLIVQFEEKDGSFDLVDYLFEKKVIISQKAFTYDEVDKILDKKKNKFNLHNLMDVAEKVEKKYGFNVGSEKSHKLVEVFMVFANMLAAKHLIEQSKVEYPLIRTHFSKPSFDQKKLDEIKDPSLKHHMYILNMNRAMYEIRSDETKDNEIFHTGLNIKYYTHYTSPIRRYADIIVHRLLFEQNKKSVDESLICEMINNVNFKTKKAQRDFDMLKIVDQLDDKPIETEGYVTDISDEKITVYITEYKQGVTFRLFDRKLSYMLEYVSDDGKLQVMNKQTRKTLTFKLLDKVKVRIVPYLKEENFKDKLKVRVLEPDTASFL